MDRRIEIASENLRSFGELAVDLSETGKAKQLLDAFDTRDPRLLAELIPDLRPRTTVCIEMIATITKVLNGFAMRFEEVCTFANVIRPLAPSAQRGQAYRLEDGTARWVSEQEWFALYDKAVADPPWREQNHALLKAIGILVCTWQLVPAGSVVDVTVSKTLCFGDGPGVIDPPP